MTIDQVRLAPLAYLATPYTKYMGGDIERAFVDASKLAARLFEAGIKIYSPIAHCHPIAIHGGIDPLNATMWIEFDEAMMSAAGVIIVAHMEGWQDSGGVLHEIEFFHARHKPIFGCDPRTLNMWRYHLIETTTLIHRLRVHQGKQPSTTHAHSAENRSDVVKQDVVQ